MKQLFALFMVLALLGAGCSEEKAPEPTQTKQIDWDKRIAEAVNKGEKPKSSELQTASHGGVTVSIKPETPIAGECLVANVKGKPSKDVYIWELNGIYAQEGPDNHYCPEASQRGDIITVKIGDDAAGGTASVTVENTLPKVLDTRIEMVPEGSGSVVVVSPNVVDPDEDYVTFQYQWVINGEVNPDHIENRLPSDAFKKGDTVQVKIIPDDGYGQGPIYQSRDINVPSEAPTITSRPPGSFQAMAYTYQVEAIDPDGGALTFSLDNPPDGMTIDAQSGALVWPLEEVAPGAYSIKIVVSDPDGDSAIQEFTVNLGDRKVAGQ